VAYFEALFRNLPGESHKKLEPELAELGPRFEPRISRIQIRSSASATATATLATRNVNEHEDYLF
jgi:hypothetical protein